MSSQTAKPKIIVILGPTSSGKTGLAVDLAIRFGGEIISADSRQVYRGMDIGSGKDLAEYVIKPQNPNSNDRIMIPYHLIDVCDPSEVFDLAKYKKMAEESIDNIINRGKLPIIVGGSGMYLEALINNYQLAPIKADLKLRDKLEAMSTEEVFAVVEQNNPAFAEKINNSDRHNKRRLIRYAEVFASAGEVTKQGEPKYNPLIIGLKVPKEILDKRIYQRLVDRLDNQDMIEEVNNLNRHGISWERLISFGLEYKFISWYLQEKIDYDQMVEKLSIAICQFAKRQMTWFRRWQKKGAQIHWLEPEELTEADQLITNFLNQNN